MSPATGADSSPLPADAFDWPPRLAGGRADLFAHLFLLEQLERGGYAQIMAFHRRQLSAYLRHLSAQMPSLAARLAELRATGRSPALRDLPIGSAQSVRVLMEGGGPLKVPAAHGALTRHRTTAADGVEFDFYRTDRQARIHSDLCLQDHFRQARDPRRAFNLIGSRVPPHDGEHTERQRPDASLETGLTRIRRADEGRAEADAGWLKRHPAPYLSVEPHRLAAILEVFARDGEPASGIEQVLVEGGVVDAELRERTRTLLGARVVDRYRTDETGPIAFQCPTRDDWYHAGVSNVILETVDEDGRPAGNRPGRVLVTAFNSGATPLLRYELGDLATLRPGCACGASLPALSGLRRGPRRSAPSTASACEGRP